MMEVWKPKQEMLPAITIVVQTRTKMPYSKLPIQRASRTWLTKAMAALTMRMEKAMSDVRPASPRSSAVNRAASIWPSSGRARKARRSGKSRSAVVAAEKRTRELSDFRQTRCRRMTWRESMLFAPRRTFPGLDNTR
ncbi:hypothetical protein MAXJ12_07397 [Mesorhizobium alhagi CCNWXJ12-2]|uniref:Uncharacterized protein n=1 Tax=Mesorhizobium alhagi CCNWXJ12-2 TaxID=1107882 RepID=H0HMW3_9HYPH|nr:hypothetical protein MAXJ12_07397 [Mesorhizobium alhagi CCNWXJ12-2]